MHSANALWPQNNYPFLPEYLTLARKHYGASITPVDYSTAPARADACRVINKWIEDKTVKRIQDFLSPDGLNDLTRMILINAIYFKGNWWDPFKTGMTTNLFINAVIQKTFVEVNEEGTEAAAVTCTVMPGCPDPSEPPPLPVFRADHPFLFAIQHVPTGSILFMGRVADPTKE